MDCTEAISRLRGMGLTILGGAVVNVQAQWYRRYQRYDDESETAWNRIRSGDAYEFDGRFIDFPVGAPFLMGDVNITPIPGFVDASVGDVPSVKDRDIKEFFRTSPRCFMVFQKVLGDKFSKFLDSLNKMKFIDVPENSDLLNKTLTELEIPNINDDGTFQEAGGTLGDLAKTAYAVTSPETNTAYLLPLLSEKKSPYSRGVTKLHEQTHKFLKANHVTILYRFGLPKQRETTVKVSDGLTVRDPMGNVILSSPPLFHTQSQESNSGIAFSDWLDKGCL
jgi:hypothetical protein